MIDIAPKRSCELDFAAILDKAERELNAQIDPATGGGGSLTKALEARESSISSPNEIGNSSHPLTGPPEIVAQVDDSHG